MVQDLITLLLGRPQRLVPFKMRFRWVRVIS